jgi:hypothetical protein
VARSPFFGVARSGKIATDIAASLAPGKTGFWPTAVAMGFNQWFPTD